MLSSSLSPVHCTGEISVPGRSLGPVLWWWCYYSINPEDFVCSEQPQNPLEGCSPWTTFWSSCSKRIVEQLWKLLWMIFKVTPAIVLTHLTCLQVTPSPMREVPALVSVKELTWSGGNAQVFLCSPREAVCDEPAASVQATFSCFSGSLQDCQRQCWFLVWLLSSACTILSLAVIPLRSLQLLLVTLTIFFWQLSVPAVSRSIHQQMVLTLPFQVLRAPNCASTFYLRVKKSALRCLALQLG